MDNQGLFIVFESAPKGGKTTLSTELAKRLRHESANKQILWGRSALTNSTFASEVKSRDISDLGYSTAFYWADLIFYTHDVIAPNVKNGAIVVHDRYDLSIVSYREAYGLHHDELLLKEYLKREMILNPDLTVFLDPPIQVMLARIAHATESSSVDRAFLNAPVGLDYIQKRMRHYLARFNRRFLTLDTDSLGIDECVTNILEAVLAISERRNM
ncbi:MAG: hypothetical protein Q8R30_05070 [bacterium]|nr:hypothetical protein [bacterium]